MNQVIGTAHPYIHALSEALEHLDAATIEEAIELLREVRSRGGTVFTCGNGGSASIASQIVVDLVKGASIGGKGRFKAMSLTDSVATLSAYANDNGYESVFVEPLKNFAQAGDVLVAISGSGNSPNVLRAVEYAAEIGCKTIGLTSADQGRLRELVDLPLLVPGRHMGRLEDCFFVMTHVLVYAFIDTE